MTLFDAFGELLKHLRQRMHLTQSSAMTDLVEDNPKTVTFGRAVA